jgi:hypothetical protein
MSGAEDSRVGQVAVTRQGQRRVRPHSAFLVASAASLQRLGPADRSTLAGRLGVPRGTLDRWIELRRSLPIEAGDVNTVTQRRSAVESLPLDLRLVERSALAAWVRWLLLAGFSAPIGLVGLYLRPVQTLIVYTTFLGVGTLWTWLRAQASSVAFRRLADDWNALSRRDALPEPWEEVRRRIAAVRVQIGSTELPGAVAVDLRGGLDAVEDRAERLGKMLQGMDAALARTPMSELAARRDEAVAALEKLLPPLESLASDVARLGLLGAGADPLAQQISASIAATTQHARRALSEGGAE